MKQVKTSRELALKEHILEGAPDYVFGRDGIFGVANTHKTISDLRKQGFG